VCNENSKWGRTEERGPRPDKTSEASSRAPRALLGAGPAWLRPPSTAHGSQSSGVFDNYPDIGVKHPTGSGLPGPTSMPKPNDA
jgi:hypothetical protein